MLSIADLNRIKCNIANAKKAQQARKKRQKSSIAFNFKNNYYYSGYKFRNFTQMLVDEKPFTYIQIGSVKNLSESTVPRSDNYFVHFWEDLLKNRTHASEMFNFVKSNDVDGKYLPRDPVKRMFHSYPKLFKQFVSAINSKEKVYLVGKPASQKIFKTTETFESVEELTDDVDIANTSGIVVLLTSNGDIAPQLEKLYETNPQNWYIDIEKLFSGSAGKTYYRKLYPQWL